MWLYSLFDQSLSTPRNAVLSIASLIGLCFLLKVVYNIWFHPLKAYPGPWYAGASRFWYSYQVFGGYHKYAIKRLHDTYGDVVRIAPDELSYIDPRAWSDIYGKSAHENAETGLEKDRDFFASAFANSDSLVDADSTNYKTQKKNVMRAFSHRQLVSKGDTMSSYIDEAILRLKAQISNSDTTSIDIDPLVGNTVLDTHAKLTIGRDFHAVKNPGSLHTIVKTMHKAVTVIQFCTQLQYLPRAVFTAMSLLPSRDIFSTFSKLPPLGPAIADRLETEDTEEEKPDFVTHMLTDQRNDDVIDPVTVKKNSFILILSGVEAVPGFIDSVLFYLLNNPQYYKTAAKEVRDAFQNQGDISTTSTQNLEFLKACLNETLRVSPPFVGTLPRRTARGGANICDKFVPGNTVVGIHNWSITHTETFWKSPNEFRPERFLKDARFKDDNRASFHPFGFGPRMCVARYLVLIEAALILAKLLFAFDMELDRLRNPDWPVHRGPFVPTRGSLYVHITPVTRV